MAIMFTFFIGVTLGVILGWWWANKNKPASVFKEGSGEAEELRVEASKAVSERIEKRKDRIMEVTRNNGRITNDGVEDLFCISDRTAWRYLHDLVETGKLKKMGSGRGVYYIPTK